MYYLEHDEDQDNQHSKPIYNSSESLSGDKDDRLSTVMSTTESRSIISNQHQLPSFNSNKNSTFDNLPG